MCFRPTVNFVTPHRRVTVVTFSLNGIILYRTSPRGRGSAHYSASGNVANNEVTVNVNRGTPAS